MRDKKFMLNWYQFNDTDAMERKLEKMAEKGWLLDRYTNWGWRFRRAEPQQVKYTMTFFPDASVFDGNPTEGQETYADYCAAAGWEFVTAYGPMQYFRSTRPDPTPIETDEGEKLRAIHKSMMKTAILSYGMLTVVWLMNLGLRISSFRRDPLSFFSSNTNLALMALMVTMLAYMIFILADYFIWYFRSKRAVEQGGACLQPHTKIRYWLSMVLLLVCALALLSYIGDITSPGKAWIFAYSFGGMALLMGVSQLVLHGMKRKGYSRGATRFAFIAVAIVLSIAYAAGIMPFVMRLNDADMMEEEATVEEIPVTLEDLGYTVVEEDHCAYEAEITKSILMRKEIYSQVPYNRESKLPDLGYTVVRPRWKWVRDLCWDLMHEAENTMREGIDEIPVDAARWGAEDVFYNTYPYGYCFLCEDSIVLVDRYLVLTDAQLALVVEKVK